MGFLDDLFDWFDEKVAPTAPLADESWWNSLNKLQELGDQATGRGTAQYDWARNEWARNQPFFDALSQAGQNISDVNRGYAATDRERYATAFQPMEDALLREAQSYASPERKQLEMGRAGAQVGQAFDAARKNAERDLEAFGVDPGATRFAALDSTMRTQQAAAQAAAENQAAQQVDATGRALRSEAIGVGMRYPGQVAGEYNTALQGATSGANIRNTAEMTGGQLMGLPTQWNQLGTQAATQRGGLINALDRFKLDRFKTSSGLGALLGGIGGTATSLFTDRGGMIPSYAGGGKVPEYSVVKPITERGNFKSQVPSSRSSRDPLIRYGRGTGAEDMYSAEQFMYEGVNPLGSPAGGYPRVPEDLGPPSQDRAELDDDDAPYSSMLHQELAQLSEGQSNLRR